MMCDLRATFDSVFDYKVVLFDYDRTIVSLSIDWLRSRKDCCQYLKGRFPNLVLNEGMRMDEMEEIAVNLLPDQKEAIFKFRGELERASVGPHTPQLLVVELIKALCADDPTRRLLVVSNNLNSTIECGLGSLGIRSCFEAILGVDDVGSPKPSTAAGLILRERYGIDCREAILVGDSPTTDGEFCRRLEMVFFDINPYTV